MVLMNLHRRHPKSSAGGALDFVPMVLMNLHRRHMEPWRWGVAFKKLLEVKGIKRGSGARNDQTSATIAEVATQLGVLGTTAEKRLRQADAFEADLSPKEQERVRNKETTIPNVRAEDRKSAWHGRGPGTETV